MHEFGRSCLLVDPVVIVKICLQFCLLNVYKMELSAILRSDRLGDCLFTLQLSSDIWLRWVIDTCRYTAACPRSHSGLYILSIFALRRNWSIGFLYGWMCKWSSACHVLTGRQRRVKESRTEVGASWKQQQQQYCWILHTVRSWYLYSCISVTDE